MSIFAFFSVPHASRIRDFEEKGMPEMVKKSSKTWDRFTAISDLQNSNERVSVQPGNRQLSRKFLDKVYSPLVPKNIPRLN